MNVSDELKVAGEAMERLRDAHSIELRLRDEQAGLMQDEHRLQIEECKEMIIRGQLEAEQSAAAAAEREGVLMMQIEDIKVLQIHRGLCINCVYGFLYIHILCPNTTGPAARYSRAGGSSRVCPSAVPREAGRA